MQISHAVCQGAIRELMQPRRRRRGQRRLKNEFILCTRISRYFKVMHFVFPCQN